MYKTARFPYALANVAFSNGLAEYAPEGVHGPLILCEDVQKAFEAIAREYRQTLDLPVVGVTGSVGKTTTKEMISAVLARRYRVLKTEGNLNNQLRQLFHLYLSSLHLSTKPARAKFASVSVTSSFL